MSALNFITTKSTEWNNRQPKTLPQWTERGDGFNVEWDEETDHPFTHQGFIAEAHPGSVWKSLCTENDEVVAVKSLQTSSNEKMNQKLREEVNILRLLRDYHVVQIYGSFTHRDSFNILMTPVATCDLRTYLYEPNSYKAKALDKMLPSRTVWLQTIMGCLAHGLRYLHQEPRVRHKDVKPANILLEGCRVLFADFGCSSVYTDTHSGTTGPTAKTPMYTSPETASEQHRNKSSDIFSLACVFAEIFTVYKGRTVHEFRNHREKSDPTLERQGHFHSVIPAVIGWLDSLCKERCDVQIVHLLRKMFSKNPAQRPEAEQVWKSLTTSTSSTGKHFCGPCCMPLLYTDPMLAQDQHSDLSTTHYASSPTVVETLGNTLATMQDLFFKKIFDPNQQLDYIWVRNVRHWRYAILDFVKGPSPNLLARKRIAGANRDGWALANNEAEILRQVKHRHIVTLFDTYQQGDIYGLLYQPAATCDLRTYLEMTELYNKSNCTLDLPLHEGLLDQSFGCLASAIASVHAAGFDHGDIGPRNILVHDGRVFLSKFSSGLKTDRGGWALNQSTTYRFTDLLGNVNPRRRSFQSAGNEHQIRPGGVLMGKYKPPEWNSEKHETLGQSLADIFALGCVFLEVHTVLSCRSIRTFEETRAKDNGENAYRLTLPATLRWLSELNPAQYEGRETFEDTLRSMLDEVPAQRPTADRVWAVMQRCKTRDGLSRCGKCCSD